MATESVSLKDVVDKVGCINDADSNKVFQIQAAIPVELSKHMVQKDYILLGITPEEFVAKHTGEEFDLTQLLTDFSIICPDIINPLKQGEGSYSLDFCAKIIYEVGPEARSFKKKDGDKIWRFRFPGKEHISNKLTMRTILVASYKTGETQYKRLADDNKLILTVKQAGLIALYKFNQLVEMLASGSDPKILLTPLAGAVFSKDDIKEISQTLPGRPNIGLVTRSINSSCQPGGQYLPDSAGHIAAVCSIVATKGLKDEKIKNSIITKTVKQYINKGKPIDSEKFMVFAAYALGGLPIGQDAITLEKMLESSQVAKINARQAIAASKSTAHTSSVVMPGSVIGGK